MIRKGSSLVAAAWLAIVLTAGPVLAAPESAVRHSGSVTGDLKQRSTVTVRVAIDHPKGWQNVQRVVIALRLRGQPLDQLVFQSSDLSLSDVGDGGPVVIGRQGALHGPYFGVDTSQAGLQARGNRLGLTIPIRLATAPPPGGRLFYSFSALGTSTPGFLALTPPVQEKGGFSWGTLGLAVAVALFAGGFVGNLFSSRRRPQRPSVYAAIQRRMDQERARR